MTSRAADRRERRAAAAVPDERGVLPPAATLYGRVLLLREVRLRWWLRALYLEGAVVVGFVLYLADWASAWVMLAFPAAIAVAVKVYDLTVFGTDGPFGTEETDGTRDRRRDRTG